MLILLKIIRDKNLTIALIKNRFRGIEKNIKTKRKMSQKYTWIALIIRDTSYFFVYLIKLQRWISFINVTENLFHKCCFLWSHMNWIENWSQICLVLELWHRKFLYQTRIQLHMLEVNFIYIYKLDWNLNLFRVYFLFVISNHMSWENSIWNYDDIPYTK